VQAGDAGDRPNAHSLKHHEQGFLCFVLAGVVATDSRLFIGENSRAGITAVTLDTVTASEFLNFVVIALAACHGLFLLSFAGKSLKMILMVRDSGSPLIFGLAPLTVSAVSGAFSQRIKSSWRFDCNFYGYPDRNFHVGNLLSESPVSAGLSYLLPKSFRILGLTLFHDVQHPATSILGGLAFVWQKRSHRNRFATPQRKSVAKHLVKSFFHAIPHAVSITDLDSPLGQPFPNTHSPIGLFRRFSICNDFLLNFASFFQSPESGVNGLQKILLDTHFTSIVDDEVPNITRSEGFIGNIEAQENKISKASSNAIRLKHGFVGFSFGRIVNEITKATNRKMQLAHLELGLISGQSKLPKFV
jgi:hypothetical protein